MAKPRYKTIGILGGMGPSATVELFNTIIKHTPARNDQEHIPILINNAPQIPDRTQALLYGGQNPKKQLIKACKTLEKAGADFIIIACNTSHAYFFDIQKELNISLINMIEETATYINKKCHNIKTAGLLATTGTVKTKLYHKHLNKNGIQVVVPDQTQQACVMEAIYGKMGIKAGCIDYPKKALQKAANSLLKQGADIIIMGCTEIPLALAGDKVKRPGIFINPVDILAKKAVLLAIKH